MHDYRKQVQTGNIPTPKDFRAQATGMGSTIQASRDTGARRAQKVVDNSLTPANLMPSSYPAKTPGDPVYYGRTYYAVADDGNGGHPDTGAKPRALNTTRPNRA